MKTPEIINKIIDSFDLSIGRKFGFRFRRDGTITEISLLTDTAIFGYSINERCRKVRDADGKWPKIITVDYKGYIRDELSPLKSNGTYKQCEIGQTIP